MLIGVQRESSGEMLAAISTRGTRRVGGRGKETEWGLGEWGVGHVLYRPSTSVLLEYFTIAMSSSLFLHFKTLLKGVKLFV